MSQESALGNICIIVDSIPHTLSPKLGSVEPGSVESFYMLAAFCFDAARKMEYMFKATREFAAKADPGLARDILRDNEAIQKAGDWKATAETAERIMRNLYEQIWKDHDQLLRRAAGANPQQ